MQALTGGPDLVETTVTAGVTSPYPASAGTSFSANDTVTNQGSASAGASSTSYFLSPDGTTKVGQRIAARAVGAIAASGTDSGPASVTITGGIPDGTYLLIACADAQNVVHENIETNQCNTATASGGGQLSIQLASPDLIVSAVTSPPGTANLGDSFMVTATTANQGAAAAGATTTHIYLSTNGIIKSKSLATQSIGSLGANDPGSPQNSSVTIPAGTAEGSYYILACADTPTAVAESNENNNCLASTTQVAVSGPNLVESGVSVNPTTLTSSDTLLVTETTENTGNADAGSSKVTLFASLTPTRDSSQLYMVEDCAGNGALRTVGPVAAGAQSTATTGALLCYKENGTGLVKPIPQGTYYLFACADGGVNQVVETSENDNCTASSNQFTIAAGSGTDPDLTEINSAVEVTSPYATSVGSTFTIADTVENLTSAAAGASTTRYWLATGTTKVGSPLGERSVPALAGGASDNGTATLTVPSGIADGSYSLITCADAGSAVMETDEMNNCVLTVDQNGTRLVVNVTSADLVVTAISNPPATVVVGQGFSITDTTGNQGSGPAVSTVTHYYLSTNGITKSRSLGSRTVPALAANDPGTPGGASVIVTGSGGAFYLLACADSTNLVSEGNENNNCLASTTKVVVIGPDLVDTTFSFTPTSVPTGGSTNVTETVQNAGTSPTTITSTVRLFASPDNVHSGDDLLVMPTCGSGSDILNLRTVPTLANGASSTATTPAQLCYRDPTTHQIVSIPAGSYYLIACSDGNNQVTELNENNNCAISSGQLTITP